MTFKQIARGNGGTAFRDTLAKADLRTTPPLGGIHTETIFDAWELTHHRAPTAYRANQANNWLTGN